MVERRHAIGISQQRLADELGIHRRTVANWETGDNAPSIDNLVLLARELDTTTDHLLGR